MPPLQQQYLYFAAMQGSFERKHVLSTQRQLQRGQACGCTLAHTSSNAMAETAKV
eukprot:CAMPEP_0179025570 /NCGR_PEP_ID=MMETSP0796-20121207/8056_1 /TAXON_ID=73915 /ORGANISM="Pyrodinium bahamense, Strain pbaha01" /LENGTH=54 /DNA_ID=CAMNT_0020721601 /DNA_START=507 /DNA_END=671 /DNA_ORIENTATION=-